MAKSITEVSANNTFQVWLDKTNEIVDLINNDIITASALGDTTIGDATLVGTLSANTFITNNLLRVDTVSPKVGSTAVSVTAPVNISTNQIVLERLSSSTGPRIAFTDSVVEWQAGFENAINRNFVITAGGSSVFRLSTAGNLQISGSVTASSFIGNISSSTTLVGLTSSIAELNHSVGVTSGIQDQLNLKAPILSPTFTGTPSAPTPPSGTNTTRIATTEFVQSTVSSGIASIPSVPPPLAGPGITVNTIDGTISMSGVYAAGDFSVTAGSITASGNVTAYSDTRLKTNVRTIDDAINKVSQMRGVYFDKDNKASTGVIAQEIEKVLPEVVFDGEYKSVAYGNIVGILIEAIKELNIKLNELSAEIKELKK